MTVSKDFLPVSRYNSMPLEDSYDLQIIAYNPGSDLYDRMALSVRLLGSRWEDRVPTRYVDQGAEGYAAGAPHHIHKRVSACP